MKHRLFFVSISVSFLVAFSYSSGFSQNNKNTENTGSILNEKELLQYLDQKEKAYESLMVTLGLNYWNYYAREGTYELKPIKALVAEFFSDPQFSSVLSEWGRKLPMVRDSLLKQRIFLWNNLHKASTITLNPEVMNLQSRIEDSISAMLAANIFTASPSLEKLTLSLIKLRNERACKLGYANFADASLDLSLMDTSFYYHSCRLIVSMTDSIYMELIKEYKEQKKINEYGLRDYFGLYQKYAASSYEAAITGDSSLFYIQKSLANIGIDYSSLPMKMFIEKELPPPVGGQGIAVRIPDDFRIVVVPNLPFSSRMHEMGHGLHGMLNTINAPVLKGYEWLLGGVTPIFSEGMAEVMAEFTRNPEWLEKYKHINPDSLKKNALANAKYFTAYVRYFLAQSMMELEIYKNPDQDLSALYNKVMMKYLLIEKPVKRPFQLTDNMIVSYPVYQHNYLFGEIVAWQVHRALRNKFGNNFVFHPQTGSFLKEKLYSDGEYYPWQQRMKRATGKELDVAGYVKNKLNP